MANGEGCMCAARYAGECACDDVDWNPPKKEFIGLTDDEIVKELERTDEYMGKSFFAGVRWAEQALKEKNHG